ncbi:MAG: hypothetical protein U5R14_04665 [Gemmatimonadota bacterium]|nr:hypothetical protein [Gemmatimonadota bacterium]
MKVRQGTLRLRRLFAPVRTGVAGAMSFALLTGLVACGGGAQEPFDGAVVSSDPELRRLAGELLPDVAERAGLELREPVRVERRTRGELEGYLRAKLDEELPPDEAQATGRAYAMLGLVEEDLDLRALLLDLYTEQVAGFYEPDSTALFVMDDQPPDALEALLLHELVHAVQDQTVDLDELTDGDLGNDRAAAAHAAIEGHATLVMLEFMMERMTGRAVDLAEVPDFGEQLLPAIRGMQDQFPALGSAPEVIQRSLLFPYTQGAGFVQHLWASEGRVPPFGSRLPTSTEQVLERDLDDAPVEVTIDVEGGTVLHDGVLGRLEVGILVETHLGSEASELAHGWGGDRYVLVDVPGSDDPVLVWAVAWDSEAARDRFLTGFNPVRDHLGPGARLEATAVSEQPAVLLVVGDASSLDVSLRIQSER